MSTEPGNGAPLAIASSHPWNRQVNQGRPAAHPEFNERSSAGLTLAKLILAKLMLAKLMLALIFFAVLIGCDGSRSPGRGEGEGGVGEGGVGESYRQAAAGPEGATRFSYSGAGPVRIAATTGMVADLVRAVGGERVAVRQLLGSGVDPHLYKISRDDVREISEADLVVYSGLLLEGKMEDTFRKLSMGQPVWAVAEGLAKSELLQPKLTGEPAGGVERGHFDPHIWMDVSLWVRCLEAFARRLGDYDPAYREKYAANARATAADWLEVHRQGAELIASIPEESRVLVTSHDAFGYFGRAYAIEVRGVQGISTESEAGLQQVNQLVDLLVERRLRAVFVESSVPRKSIEAVVAGAATRGQRVGVAGPLYADAMGESGTEAGTYAGMMRQNFRLIAGALKGKPAAEGDGSPAE